MERFVFGSPYKTFAVVGLCVQGQALAHFSYGESADGRRFTCPLPPDAIVYGLGETMHGVNKRGYRYISYNTDDPHHRQDMPSLYGAHNFLVVAPAAGKPFGVFFDTPSRVTFDVDVNGSGLLEVLCEGPGVTVYLIHGESPYAIVREFLHAIGRSYIPPLWGFGFGQSRWGYKTREDFDAVAAGYQNNGLPLDYICMDIDYMDRYIDFTVNRKRFPDLGGYAEALKTQGIRLVPIIDAGVKVEPGDKTYDEGVEKGYFCLNHEGKPFKAAVWPGMTHFTDFFQPQARAWFGSRYQTLTDLGIEGFWNDMNEPSIFYSEYTKKGGAARLRDLLFPKTAESEAGKKVENGAYIDYHNFYHNVEGEQVVHHDVHNLYGGLMTQAAAEGLDKLLPGRYLLFTRASIIGAHRYGGIWTGDNHSSWEMLRQNVYQMPGLNMCGFLFSGADTGGFGGNCDRELLLRWLAFSIFTPLLRNHAALATRRQECYQFGDPRAFAAILHLRYRLLPYLYSEYMKAALSSDMFLKPLAFVWPDDAAARDIEDQLMVGEAVMIAPVLEPGARGRRVYLPEPMTEVRWNGQAFVTCPALPGWRNVAVPADKVVFFIRQGHAIPVGRRNVHNTGEVDLTDVRLLGDGEGYDQYVDDGVTRAVSAAHIRRARRKAAPKTP